MRNHFHLTFLQTSLMSFLVLGTVSAASAQTQESVPAANAVSQTAVVESVARQGAADIAKEAAFAAAEYMAQCDYEKAVDKYLLVISNLSSKDASKISADHVAGDLEAAKRNLADAYKKWAEQLYYEAQNSANNGAYDEAIEKCGKASEVYPPYKQTLDELAARYASMKKAKEFKQENNINQIDPNAENRAYRISVRLEKGKTLYKAKRYDKALDEFNAVITLDPYNMTAIEYQTKIYQKLIQEGRARKELTALEAISEVSWKMLSPIAVDSSFGEENMEYIATKYDRVSKDIQKKLEEIRIDHLSYSDEPIKSVIDDLRKKSRENDISEQTGVNFVFRAVVPDYQELYGKKKEVQMMPGGRPGDPDAMQGAGGDAGLSDPMARFRGGGMGASPQAGGMSPNMRATDPDAIYDRTNGGGRSPMMGGGSDPMARFRNNANMNSPMGMNSDMNGMGMGMEGLDDANLDQSIEKVEEYPITVELDNVTLAQAIDYICRSANLHYRIEENAVVIAAPEVSLDDFETSIFPIEKEALELLGKDGSPDAVMSYFIDRGVPFPMGAKCVFDDAISRLIVTNTPKNLDMVADIINQMNVIDPQVLMHVKFVEINANDVQELGFEYTFSRVSTDSSVSHPEGSVESLLYLMPPDYYSLAYVSDNTSVWKAEKSFGIFTESVGTTDDNAGGFAKIHDKVTASNVQTINSGTYFSFPNDMDNTAYYYVDLPDKSRAVTFGSNSNLVRNAKDDPTAFNADQVSSDTIIEWSHYNKDGYSWNAKIHALDQADSSEILATPRLIAMNGEQATIRMVTEKYYPTSWDECELDTVSSGNKSWIVFTPSKPDLEEKEEGVVLQVRPQVDDNYAITLMLSPTIQAMVDWTDYSYDLPLTDDNGNTAYFPNTLKMPIMEVRNLQTTVTSYDGQTVVLGGVIRDSVSSVEDQYPILGDVPLIGRLFQSKGRGSKKTNMLVFLTSTLVNPDGTPLRENDAHGLPSF